MNRQPQKPPYVPTTWALGGASKLKVDVPITAVFLALFMIGAATHMTIFQLNRRKGHKFLFSGLMFGFCMARITTCVMRIASVCLPTNVRLAIAASIFVAAGVVILYIVNLVFAQRMIRASHPNFGWTKALGICFKALYVLIILTIIILITAVVQSFYTLNTNIRRIDRDIQLYGATCFAVLSFLPIPLLLSALIVPRKQPLDKFGSGRWHTKIYILLTGATLICFGASYRTGTSWLTPVPRTQPLPSYYSKPAFYIVNFTVEILTIYLYAFTRVDQRWHVPDGASKRQSYITRPEQYGFNGLDKRNGDEEEAPANMIAPTVPLAVRQMRSEETFADRDTLVEGLGSDAGSKYRNASWDDVNGRSPPQSRR